MSALPLFDIVLASYPGPAVPERVLRVAEQSVRFLLAEYQAIEELDLSVAPADTDDFDPQATALVRGMYEAWANESDAMLERVARLERAGAVIGSAETLEHKVGRTRAMLGVTVQDLLEAREQVRAGRVHTIEEVRRELRLSAQR